MRNLLALFAMVVLVFAGVGWYRDWYRVQTTPSDVHITINRDKVSSDVRRGEERLHDALDGDPAPQPTKRPETSTDETHKPL
jgi:hypothetical protein